MKCQFVLLGLAVLLALSNAAPMPRYLVIPLTDELAEQVFASNNHQRFRRSAQQEELQTDVEARVVNQNRRQGGPQVHVGGPEQTPFINAVRAAGIPNADDSLAAGSNVYGHPPKGNDYVDYGAYTGKHGAFGWYTDHAVALNKHH